MEIANEKLGELHKSSVEDIPIIAKGVLNEINQFELVSLPEARRRKENYQAELEKLKLEKEKGYWLKKMRFIRHYRHTG